MKFIDSSRDPWRAHQPADPAAQAAPTHALLALQDWLDLDSSARERLARGSRIGLLLPNDFELEALAPELPRLSLLALQFPKWTDGRAYTQARLLRLRHRYTGELRATGQVLVDGVEGRRRAHAATPRAAQPRPAGRCSGCRASAW